MPLPSLPSNVKTAPPTRAERGRHRDVLLVGLRMCAEAGKAEPTVADAVWELLIEAADTLKRLPDRERRWLASGTRSSWPRAIREYGEAFAAAVASGGRWEPMSAGLAPPSAGAIGRLETVMEWLIGASRRSPPRETNVAFALAAGVPVPAIRRRFGIARRTVYALRDRGLRRIRDWLEETLAE